MEYATRDQAQNAVATLSNQNLMGRLVYVREVRILVWLIAIGHDIEVGIRTVRRNLDSAPPEAEVVMAAVCKAVMAAAAPAAHPQAPMAAHPLAV